MDDPYRTNAKPLAALIPRDRRREKAAILLVAGIALGVAATLALTRETSSVVEALPTVAATAPPPPVASVPYATQVEAVVAAHRVALRGECWSRGAATAHLDEASVRTMLRLRRDGSVARATATSDTPQADALLACVEAETRAWRFPPPPEGTETIVVPFVFKRE